MQSPPLGTGDTEARSSLWGAILGTVGLSSLPDLTDARQEHPQSGQPQMFPDPAWHALGSGSPGKLPAGHWAFSPFCDRAPPPAPLLLQSPCDMSLNSNCILLVTCLLWP